MPLTDVSIGYWLLAVSAGHGKEVKAYYWHERMEMEHPWKNGIGMGQWGMMAFAFPRVPMPMAINLHGFVFPCQKWEQQMMEKVHYWEERMSILVVNIEWKKTKSQGNNGKIVKLVKGGRKEFNFGVLFRPLMGILLPGNIFHFLKREQFLKMVFVHFIFLNAFFPFSCLIFKKL